jgi:hypothetical protein
MHAVMLEALLDDVAAPTTPATNRSGIPPVSLAA